MCVRERERERVCVRERECVCVCVRERERKRARMCVCVMERETETDVCVCVCVRESMCVSVCSGTWNLIFIGPIVAILKHSPDLSAIWAPTSQTGLCSVFLQTLLLHPGYLFLELTTPRVRRVVVTSRLRCRWVQAKWPGFASTVQAKTSTAGTEDENSVTQCYDSFVRYTYLVK